MPFDRESIRHPLALRRATVVRVQPVVPSIVRITLGGPELAGFVSAGPADHVKVFFPDPATGGLLLPEVRPEGLSRPAETGTIISRDLTPLPAADGTLELDFVLHGDEGLASAWAARAAVGDELGIGGPRGSRLAPAGLGRLLIVADETALPATRRWLDAVPASTSITALLSVADDSVTDYLAGDDRLDAEWLVRGMDDPEESLRSLGPVGEDTFVFMAGEATALVPLRRYLRYELGLPREQVAASGYWKRGIVNRDHHEPLDPSDPD